MWASQLGSIAPLVVWQSHAHGSLTELNPAAFTASIICCVGGTPPHMVSLQMASKVLPRFQPNFIFPAMDCAVGNCAQTCKDIKSPMRKIFIFFICDRFIVRS